MAYVKFERPELPLRDVKVELAMRAKRLVFNVDCLATFDFSSYKFIAMFWDATISKMAFRKSDSVSDLASFDFAFLSQYQASAGIGDFIDFYGIDNTVPRIFDIAYDEGEDLYILTERI